MPASKRDSRILDECRNMFGPLPPHVRRRLTAVLRNPTPRTWDNAYSIIVGAYERPGRATGKPYLATCTLWQAWRLVDPTAPDSKPSGGPWARTPDQFTLYRAIKAVTVNPTFH